MFTKITCNFKNSPVRREKLHGRDHIVAPLAMITAGVHNGSNGPLLYEEGDIKAAVPAWNMKPIVVYHPTLNGGGISAADKDVLEKQQVGILMNTSFTDGKLRAEAWIDEEQAGQVDDRVLEALENNNVMEVSTGLFTTNEEAPGTFDGKDYTAIARAHQPDHLALLPDQIGACSVEAGAGLLVANGLPFEGAEVMDVARRIVGNAMSHDATRQLVAKAIEAKVGRVKKTTDDGDSYTVGPWVVDIYPKFAIYEVDNKLYKLGYKTGKGGAELVGEAEEVYRVTEYRTANKNKFVGNAAGGHTTKHKTMQKKEIVDGLITNAETPYAEEDRETLMNTDEAILNKMASGYGDKKKKTAEEEEKETVGKKKKKTTENASPEAAQAAPATMDNYLAGMPKEMQDMVRNGVARLAEDKEKVIATITANTNNKFTKEFLESKDLKELEGIAALAAQPAQPAPTANSAPPMFVGQATPASAPVQNAEGEEALEAPSMSFD